MPSYFIGMYSQRQVARPGGAAEVTVPSTKKSNAGKNNFMSDALGRHEYQLAVEFILELLTESYEQGSVVETGSEVW